MKQLLVAIFVMALGGTAWAQNAHFVRGAVNVDSEGDGVCTFKVSGYGNLPTGSLVQITCSADANACYACKNNGGNFPTDPKKQQETGVVSGFGLFPVGHNGTVSGAVDFEPPASTLSCPGNQVPVLVSVTYSDISLSSDSSPSDPGADATLNIQGDVTRKLENAPRAQC